jgi:3-oxoacyl-[acyl-carrier protein] reductase
MLLESNNAIIYGGGGAVGSAVARPFAAEGARVYLAGRTLDKLEKAAEVIRGDAATLEDIDNVAAFVASDKARSMTPATANVSCGALID